MPNLPRPFLSRSLYLLAATFLSTALYAQQPTPASRLASAKGLYYTPTAAGLKSFQCKASIDWKDLLARFGAGDLPDDNAYLVYLKSVKLTVNDDLNGTGALQWEASGNPPDGTEESVGKIHDGMLQIFTGFFQSWNPYMNGGLFESADNIALTANAGGVHLHGTEDKGVVDEQFDKNMLLTDMHFVSAAMDVTSSPTFIDTPNGRIVSSIRSLVQQPPSAPPTEVTMSATYAPVSSFQLPSTLTVEVKNVAAFRFALSECTVQTSAKAPLKP